MSMRDLSLISVKIASEHIDKLEDIARHDTVASGKLVTRSTLIRAAIARLISGRKDALYSDPGE